MLPSNERREIENVEYKKIWIYGAPFSGKTTFADGAPNPLMLNTDGNIKFVTAPYIHVKDEIKVKGRIKETIFAWQQFKAVVDELEMTKGENGFDTIVLDLLEDYYQFARAYILDKNGWTHESDDSFKSWKMIDTEFLMTMKRLLGLPYNFILVSHENLSRDITKPSGQNITQIKPNMRDVINSQISGMVDVVGRAVVDDDVHKLTFKTSPVEFGGGRIKTKEINLSWKEFESIYDNIGGK